MIRKRGNRYYVISHTTGKSLGNYASRAEAVRRLKQIRMWKAIKKRAGR